MEYGIISIIPPILALALALLTKDIMLALFCGIASCSLIIHKAGFVMPIISEYISNGVAGNVDFMLYGVLLGIFLVIIKKSGGFAAFARIAEKRMTSSKKAKLLTWLFSGLVFNDSLGTIGVGSVMRPMCDKNKVSREKLGFILTSTSEPLEALVPFAIHIMFFGGLVGSILPDTNGAQEYIKAIPMNFFCILTAVMGLLVAAEILPDIGYMKKREKAAREKGELIRPGSTPMAAEELDEMKAVEIDKPDILCFILPFAAFIISVIVIQMITGNTSLSPAVFIGVLVAMAYSLIRGYIKFKEIPEVVINGAKSMMPLLVILALAFGFGQAVTAVGFADYIVKVTSSLLTPAILPALVFIICALVSYGTGSIVSAAVVLTPLALALATGVNANLTLTIAALVGGSTFGDCSSPLSDIVIKSAMGAGVDVVDLAKAQFVPRLIVAAISIALYLAVGLI